MMNKILLILILFCLSKRTTACGNEYGHSLDGKMIPLRFVFIYPETLKFNETEIKKRIKEIRQELKNNPANYKALSDLALNLMKMGKSDTAIKILKPLALKYPNEYNIIANLGTAYELNGKLDSALKYIKRDLEINPDSHRSSEWIHVKILEAKIKEKRNPGWIQSHSIIDLNEALSKIDTSRIYYTLNGVQEQILYQIRTRVPFTPAPDKVISNLFITLAEINKKSGTYENALLSYAYALQFESSYYKKEFIEKRIKQLNIARDSIGKFPGVDRMFLYFMKKSELNTDLMLTGLNSFALHLDSIETSEKKQQDSIQYLKSKVDSLGALNNKKENVSVKEETQKKEFIFIYVLSGILGGLLIMWGIQKLRK